MARTATFIERQYRYVHESREAGHDQGREIPLRGDVLMERILRRIKTTSQEEVLKKIAPLAAIRRHKVLDIRHRIAGGTYDVADRLDGVVERVLKATRNAWECQPRRAAALRAGVSTCVTSLSCLAADRCTRRR